MPYECLSTTSAEPNSHTRTSSLELYIELKTVEEIHEHMNTFIHLSATGVSFKAEKTLQNCFLSTSIDFWSKLFYIVS